MEAHTITIIPFWKKPFTVCVPSCYGYASIEFNLLIKKFIMKSFFFPTVVYLYSLNLFSMKIIGKCSQVYIICFLLIGTLLWSYSSDVDLLSTRITAKERQQQKEKEVKEVGSREQRIGVVQAVVTVSNNKALAEQQNTDYGSYPVNICGQIERREKAHRYHGNIGHGIDRKPVTYILTAKFIGQQGAGTLGLLSQQCFCYHLGIPVTIVEPFLMKSVLGHVKSWNNKINLLKFSDTFNIHNFNNKSARSGYSPLATWEDFLSNAQEKTILVELQSGEHKLTKILWEATTTSTASCYSGEKYSALKQLATCTVCIVRIVTVCCIHSEIAAYESELTMKELRNALFGKWKPEEVNLLFTYWSAYWQVPSASCKNFHPIRNFHSSNQLLKQAKEYENLYVKSNHSTIAFVLRFEYLVAAHYDIDACMQNLYEAPHRLKISTKSVLVAADIGKYRSNSWEKSLSEFYSKNTSQLMETFKSAVTLLIRNQWTFEEWENSFTKVTAGTEDNGYIAALQKTIASRADCIVFLVQGGNFQYLVIEEYVKHHRLQSEQCIHYICHRPP